MSLRFGDFNAFLQRFDDFGVFLKGFDDSLQYFNRDGEITQEYICESYES